MIGVSIVLSFFFFFLFFFPVPQQRLLGAGDQSFLAAAFIKEASTARPARCSVPPASFGGRPLSS